MPEQTTPEPRPAATILLVRDGRAGLEVFMIQRHHQIDFATGAMVFPGGKLEPGDRDPALRGRCAGISGLTAEQIAFRVAAIRETFEECRVLLARPRGSAPLVSSDQLRRIEAHYREALDAHQIRISAVAETEDLELACDLIVPFAHWITPDLMPKRFDTHFFLAAAPPEHVAVHDGVESVDSVWITPEAAVEAERAGRWTIIFPTLQNLRKLGRSATVAEALDAASRDPVVTVLPRIETGPMGPVLRIPESAGYDVCEAPFPPTMGPVRTSGS